MLLGKKWLPPISRSFSWKVLTGEAAPPRSRSWQVSSNGRMCNPHGVISLGSAHSSGYLRVRICGEDVYVHRVVALAFRGPPPSEDAWQVHHKDGDRSNNHVTNLEYATCSQNHYYSHASGTRRCGGPVRSKPVMYRAVGCKDWTRCHSMTSAALGLGVTPQAVSSACRRQKPLKGYEICVADLHHELPGEEWRPMLCSLFAEEVPGRMVSSLGRVRARHGKIHNGSPRNGYLGATYTAAFGIRTEYVHRLVAVAFLGPSPSLQQSHVNHKDGDRENNAASNLEYVTPAQNLAHYHANKSAQLEGKSRSGSKPVWCRPYNSNDEWTWHPSMTSAAKVLGIWQGSISNCTHGKCRQAGGVEFRADVFHTLPGEQWRDVDVAALVEDKRKRMHAHLAKSA